MNQPRTLTSRPPHRWALTIALCLVPAAMLGLPAVASAEDGCSNAVFRSGPSLRLPDCRAYEMVTPPYKEGFPVGVGVGSGVGDSVGVSLDGSRIAGSSLGVFAGAENSTINLSESLTFGANYVFTRGEDGWEPTAVIPPAAQYPHVFQDTSSADISNTLWNAATPAQAGRKRSIRRQWAAASELLRAYAGWARRRGRADPSAVCQLGRAATRVERRRVLFPFRGGIFA